MWAQGRAVRNKEFPQEGFEDKTPQSMEKSAGKKNQLIPTHIHDHKLKACVTAREPAWIQEKKPCPSKDADAQEELTQELRSPHSQWDQLDKCH